jgi:hypothetical protein
MYTMFVLVQTHAYKVISTSIYKFKQVHAYIYPFMQFCENMHAHVNSYAL